MFDIQTKPTAEKLTRILSHLDANDYSLWTKVSSVLGREYPNNQEVLAILHQWGATASNRQNKDYRKEEKNFSDASAGRDGEGKKATIASIIALAKANGFVNRYENKETKVKLKQKVIIANVVDEKSNTFSKHNDGTQALIKWLFTCKNDERVKFILNNSQNIYFLPESEQNILYAMMRYMSERPTFLLADFQKYFTENGYYCEKSLRDYLLNSSEIYSIEDAQNVCQKLKERALMLDTIVQCEQIKKAVNNDNYEEYSDKFTKLFQSHGSIEGLEVCTSADSVIRITRRLKELSDIETLNNLYLPTSFATVDNIVKGFRRGECTLIGAHSGVGKTWLSVFFSHNALKNNKNVLFFSTEMDTSAIELRLFCMSNGIAEDRITPDRADIWRFRMGDFAEKIKSWKWSICASRNLDIEDIEKQIKFIKLAYGVDFVVIDYLQLITNTKFKGEKFAQIKNVMERLCSIAQHEDVAVCVMAQLNRPQYKIEKDKTTGTEKQIMIEPTMYDFAQSTQIVHDCATVFLLFRRYTQRGFDLVLKNVKSRYTAICKEVYLDRDDGGSFSESALGQGNLLIRKLN